MGNLCNDKIEALMNQTMTEFGFDRVRKAEAQLLK